MNEAPTTAAQTGVAASKVWNVRTAKLHVAAIILTWAASFVAQYALVAPHRDVAWLLIAAERLRRGESYLTSVLEPNPPLALLVYAPGGWLSQLLHWGIYPSFLVYTYVLVALSLAASTWCFSHIFAGDRVSTATLSLVYTVLITLLPREIWGQREHLMLILVFPWLIWTCGPRLTLVRLANSRLAPVLGFAAGIGCSIKPPYMLLGLLVLGFRCWEGRAWQRCLGRDLVGFGVAASCYALLIPLCFPEYFEVFHFARYAYVEYANTWRSVLPIGFGYLTLVMLALFATRRRSSGSAHVLLFRVLAGSAVVCALVFIMQKKGWYYHLYPALVLAGMVSSVLLLDITWLSRISGRPLVELKPTRLLLGHSAETLLPRVAMLLVWAAALVIWLISSSRSLRSYTQYEASALVQTIRSTRSEGSAIFAFSTGMVSIFPMVMLENLVWASRSAELWVLPALVKGRQPQLSFGDPSMTLERLQERVIQFTIEDFERYQPKLVLVDRTQQPQALNAAFDFLEYYLVNPRFQDIWAHYAKLVPVEVEGFDIYRLNEAE